MQLTRTLAVLLSALLIGSPPGISAADKDKRPEFSVNSAIERVLTHNSALQIAHYEITRAQNRLQWSGRLPNPQLEASRRNDLLIGNRDREGSIEIGFSQAFPITSRLQEEKELNRIQVLLAMAEVDAQKRAMAYRAHQLAVEILYRKDLREARQQMIATQEEFTRFVQQKAAAAEMSALDVTQSQLAVDAMKRELLMGEVELDPMLLELGMLMNLGPGVRPEIKGKLTFPSDSPTTRADASAALANRPDYLASWLRLDLANAGFNLETAKRWEDLTVKVFAEHEREAEDRGGTSGNSFVGVGISIPLPLHQKNEAEIQDAAIRAEAATREIQYKAEFIRKELAAALATRKLAWEIAREASGKSLELAKKNYLDFRTAYEGGQAEMSRLQEAREQWLKQEETALDLQRRFQLTEVELRHILAVYPGYRPSVSRVQK